METAVLIDLFFRDLPMEERIEKIASCGYSSVETWGGGDAAGLSKIAEAGAEHGISLVSVVINSPNDDDAAPVRKENSKKFLERVDRYSDNALAAGCGAGIVTSGNLVEGIASAELNRNLTDCLRKAGELARGKGFNLNLEPLNTIVDHAGQYLDSREKAVGIVREVNLPAVKMLYDIYHMEIMSGNQVEFIRENIDAIGHFHSAGVPGRHELFSGETNYPFVLEKIAESGYKKYFGLEYVPLLEDAESLTKTLQYLSEKSSKVHGGGP